LILYFVLPHWWQGVFHNQSALALKYALKFRKDTVVVNVPFLLEEDRQAREEMVESLGLRTPDAEEVTTLDRVEAAAPPGGSSGG
jgi:hypothetical protein